MNKKFNNWLHSCPLKCVVIDDLYDKDHINNRLKNLQITRSLYGDADGNIDDVYVIMPLNMLNDLKVDWVMDKTDV